MNEETVQYLGELVINDYVSEIDLQRYNPEKRLDKEKQSSNDVRDQ